MVQNNSFSFYFVIKLFAALAECYHFSWIQCKILEIMQSKDLLRKELIPISESFKESFHERPKKLNYLI